MSSRRRRAAPRRPPPCPIPWCGRNADRDRLRRPASRQNFSDEPTETISAASNLRMKRSVSGVRCERLATIVSGTAPALTVILRRPRRCRRRVEFDRFGRPGRPEKKRPAAGRVDHADLRNAVADQRDVDGEIGVAVDELLGAVERVDQEERIAEIGRHDAFRRLFLGDAGDIRKRGAQAFEDDLLAGAVGLGHRRGVGLLRSTAQPAWKTSMTLRPAASASRSKTREHRRVVRCRRRRRIAVRHCRARVASFRGVLPSPPAICRACRRWISGFSGAS